MNSAGEDAMKLKALIDGANVAIADALQARSSLAASGMMLTRILSDALFMPSMGADRLKLIQRLIIAVGRIETACIALDKDIDVQPT